MRKQNKNKMAGENAWIERSIKSILMVPSCVYIETIILTLGESWQNIYLASRLGKYSATIHLDFKE